MHLKFNSKTHSNRLRIVFRNFCGCMAEHAMQMSVGTTTANTKSNWVFGYGSLMWRVGFEYEERVVGFIREYKRRFWQQSTDHRGVPEKPGRVVTLVPSDLASDDANEITWGIAYRIHPNKLQEVKDYLDHRERGGYSVVYVDVYKDLTSPPIVLDCMVYVGHNTNPNYVGPAPLEEIAQQIYSSVGPSGPNIEYLFQLCDAMRLVAPQAEDPHLFELERLVRAIIAKEEQTQV